MKIRLLDNALMYMSHYTMLYKYGKHTPKFWFSFLYFENVSKQTVLIHHIPCALVESMLGICD